MLPTGFCRHGTLDVAMRVLPDVLVYHRLHQSNLTRRKRQQSSDEFLGLVKASLDRRRMVKVAS